MFLSSMFYNKRNETLQNRRKQKILIELNQKFGIQYQSIIEKLIDQHIDLFDQNLNFQQIEDKISQLFVDYFNQVNNEKAHSKDLKQYMSPTSVNQGIQNQHLNGTKIQEDVKLSPKPQSSTISQQSQHTPASVSKSKEILQKNESAYKELGKSQSISVQVSERKLVSQNFNQNSNQNQILPSRHSQQKVNTQSNFQPQNQSYQDSHTTQNLKDLIQTSNIALNYQNLQAKTHRQKSFDDKIVQNQIKDQQNEEKAQQAYEFKSIFDRDNLRVKARQMANEQSTKLNQLQQEYSKLNAQTRHQTPRTFKENFVSHVDDQEIRRKEYIQQFEKNQNEFLSRLLKSKQIDQDQMIKISRSQQKKLQIYPDQFYIENQEKN